MAQLYVKSICTKIEILLCHINSDSTLGKLLCMNLNWTQLHSGLGTCILNTKTNTNYMTQTWFHPIKQFLNGINASIQIKHLWYPKNLHQNDIILMDKACQCMISNNNLIYFQVIALSHITTLDRLKIKEWYLTKKASYKYQSPSLLRWPIQNQPDISTFKVWLSTLKQILSFGTGGALKEPQGRWISNPILICINTNTILYGRYIP
jgi:hypothetical protein